jgi:hypothetical protein
MISSVASGRCTVSDIQRDAAAVVADYGHVCPMVNSIASLGGHGDSLQNSHRDFLRYTSKLGVFLEPYTVNVEHRRQTDHGSVLRAHPVVLPHELFAAAWSSGDATFAKTCLGDAGQAGLREFWTRQRHTEWVRQHPGFTDFHNEYDTSIPIGVHADKGSHTNRDNVLNISWGSCMSTAATSYSKQLFTVVPEDLVLKGRTDEQLYAVLVLALVYLRTSSTTG